MSASAATAKIAEVRHLWRERDVLFKCVQLATIARRKGKSTYETAFTMPRLWRYRAEREPKHVTLPGGLVVELLSVIRALRPRVVWIRGDVQQARTVGWLRLQGVEQRLRFALLTQGAMVDETWQAMLREREKPCERCQVRFYGGLHRWMQQVYREIGEDTLSEDAQDLLEFEQEQESHLSDIGHIKAADYRAWRRQAGVAASQDFAGRWSDAP